MRAFNWMCREAILFVVVSATCLCGAHRTNATPPPEKLTIDTYEAIKARVIPTKGELAWQQVRWRDGFFEGLLEAQAADKPLFYWIYEGDPRGNC